MANKLRIFAVALVAAFSVVCGGCSYFASPEAASPAIESGREAPVAAVTAATVTETPTIVATSAPSAEVPAVEVTAVPIAETEPVGDIFAELFAQRKSDVWVEGTGVVARLLADDNDGSRHQRFILSLPGGQTLLIAHNIDVADRVEGLAVGDVVSFRGEYYYNEQGGGVHWTHSDPDGEIDGGWLMVGEDMYK